MGHSVRGVALLVPPLPPLLACPVLVDWEFAPPSPDAPPVVGEPPTPVLPVLAPPEPVSLAPVPLLAVVVVVAVAAGVPPLVLEPFAVLLAALVALTPAFPVLEVAPVAEFPFTLLSAAESSLQPQGKQSAAKKGKYRDSSM